MAPISFSLIKFLRRKERASWPKDVVILHQFERGFRAPNMSPFCLKLETWIRMAKIKYQVVFEPIYDFCYKNTYLNPLVIFQNDFTFQTSPKKKSPWITYKGKDMGDSQLIIEYLMKEYNVDLSAHLSPLEKSMARAYLKLNEESFRWAAVVHRFKYGKPKDFGVSSFVFKLAKRSMLKDAFHQGYGKHTKDEVYDIGFKDMEALEAFLEGKKFFLGDRVCNEDASLFAVIAQVINHDRGPFNEYFMKNCPNMQRYYETMKALYWPDWDESIREKTVK